VFGTLSWPNGDNTTKSFSIPIIDDTVAESTETVFLALTNPTGGAELGTLSVAVLTIVDDEVAVAGTIEFKVSMYLVTEDTPTVTVAAARTGGSTGAISVVFATADYTAVAGSDYVAATGILSWADGETADKTFTVTILNDLVAESLEVGTMRLSNPTGGAILGPLSAAVLMIVDDD
jgi:hypothetical protein